MPLTSLPVMPACANTPRMAADRSVPPILGTLFGPQRALHAHLFVRSRESCADGAAIIHQEGARAAGANVDTQPHRPLAYNAELER